MLPFCQFVQDPKQINTRKEVSPAKLVIVTCFLQGKPRNHHLLHSCSAPQFPRPSHVGPQHCWVAPRGYQEPSPLLSPGGMPSQKLTEGRGCSLESSCRKCGAGYWGPWPQPPLPGAPRLPQSCGPRVPVWGEGKELDQVSFGSAAPEDHSPDKVISKSKCSYKVPSLVLLCNVSASKARHSTVS